MELHLKIKSLINDPIRKCDMSDCKMRFDRMVACVCVCVCWHQMRQRFVSFVWCIRNRKWYVCINVWEYMRLVIDCCRWYHIHIVYLPLCSPKNTNLNFRNGLPKSPEVDIVLVSFYSIFFSSSISRLISILSNHSVQSLSTGSLYFKPKKKKNTTNTHAQAHTSCQYFFRFLRRLLPLCQMFLIHHHSLS